MPLFVHSPLLWGLLAVGLPILIHLINLLRQRRVQWAAMEFLLESQRKHRTWILLKQLLLLLLRMAALACVVLMLAQPLLRNEWSQVFGDGDTHHIVLVDDSFSMSDRGAGKSAFEHAGSVLARLATEAQRQSSNQRMTVLRFSHATPEAGGAHPDLTSQPLTTDVVTELERSIAQWQVSHTDAGPETALSTVNTLSQADSADRRVVYVLSDFRTRQWADNPQLRAILKQLDDADVKLQLVNCTDDLRPNRSISRLKPVPGTRSAGLPVYVDIDVTNHSGLLAENVEVRVQIDGKPFERDLLIPKIAPHEAGTVRFAFKREQPGAVRIVAHIDDDAIALDNVRRAVVHLPPSARALILSPILDSDDVKVIYSALQTGESTTGIKVDTHEPRYLRDASPADLRNYDAIYVVNVRGFDDPELAALEQYAASGGGVAFFGGELVDPEVYNSMLYRDGEGIFPLPFSRAKQLPVDRIETAPDIETAINPHIEFRTGERNPLVDLVAIRYYLATFASWQPDKKTEVIAELRNGAPLVVVKRFGQGRVIAIMTKASSSPSRDMPSWHNWHHNPDFPGMLNKIQAFLSPATHTTASQLVGQPITVEFDAEQYDPAITVRWPTDETSASTAPPRVATIEAEPLADQPGQLSARIGGTSSGTNGDASMAQIDLSGIYLVEKKSLAGADQIDPVAVNVAAAEGDLAGFDAKQLAAELPDVDFEYHQSSSFAATDDALPGTNLGPYLLYLLLALLVIEQLIAYSASYHSGSRGAVQ
jgi:hypothetical protein